MKVKVKILCLVLCIFPLALHAQVKFTEIETLADMTAARKKASDQMLMLYVDVYATWCGPCKMMDSEVYTDPAVSAYMNEHYLSVRLDGESEYGSQYASEQGLRGYPSMFIFSDKGERVSQVVGYTPPGQLVEELTSINEGFGQLRYYRNLYQKGTLDAEEFASYIAVVRDMGNEEEADGLASEYIQKQLEGKSKLSDDDIRVVAFYLDVGDAWWEELYVDPGRLRRVLGEDYMLAMEEIYNNTLSIAVDEERVDLISKMANELSPLVEQETNTWDLRSLPFIQYYYFTNKTDDLISYVDERFATDRKGDHRWLFGAASQITDMDQQYQTRVLLEKELEWYAACIEMEEQFDYFFYQGIVQYFLKEGDLAKASFQKAQSLAATKEQLDMVQQVLSLMNGV